MVCVCVWVGEGGGSFSLQWVNKTKHNKHKQSRIHVLPNLYTNAKSPRLYNYMQWSGPRHRRLSQIYADLVRGSCVTEYV